MLEDLKIDNFSLNKWLSKKTMTLVNYTNSKVTDFTQLFLEGEKQVDNLDMIDRIKLAIEISPDNFKNFILEEISQKQPLTNWQEWEIYKIEIENKQYIVAKKRFDNNSDEASLHKEAFDISKKSSSWVKVPEIFFEFSDWKNEYIIMEYVEWRTLYTMIWEEIINSKLIPLVNRLINKGINEWNNIYRRYLSDIEDLKMQYWKWKNIITFDNDYETINWMRSISSILFELWYLDWDFDSYVLIWEWNQRYYKTEQKLLNTFLNKIKIFNEEDKRNIKEKLRLFLDDLHKNWFYHRDLWKNFRNIIINWTDIAIIDFWRSINNKWINYDYDNGYYTSDNDIIGNINLTGNKSEDKIESSIDYLSIISSWKKVWLDINESQINAYSSLNINLEKVLDDFIEWKDHSYDWFIYLTNKPWNKDFEWKEKSTNKWKIKLFILLSLLSNYKSISLNSKIDEYLQEPRSSRKHKYAEIFKNYII